MNKLDYTKVLVVDDEIDLCELMKDEIEYAGFDVKIAANGIDALEILKEFPAFLIFTDINMPLMDGIELLEHIQKKDGIRPYIVICTGFGGYEKEHLIAKGALEFLEKPYSFSEIETILEKVTSKQVS
jgi:CheY-like chemotaxis protein